MKGFSELTQLVNSLLAREDMAVLLIAEVNSISERIAHYGDTLPSPQQSALHKSRSGSH